jgi:hypothetical protein
MKGLRVCSLNRLRHLIYDNGSIWFLVGARQQPMLQQQRRRENNCAQNSQTTQTLTMLCQNRFCRSIVFGWGFLVDHWDWQKRLESKNAWKGSTMLCW